MVLRYIIMSIGILFVGDVRSVDLDTLLTNIQDEKDGIKPAATEPVLAGSEVPKEAKSLVEPTLPGAPKNTSIPNTEEPKLPVVPKLSEPIVSHPMPIVLEPKLPQAKPIQIPAISMTPKLPTPQIATQTLSRPMIATAEPVGESVEATAEVTSEGLDTLNIDSGGNWLEKRIWYKKAEQEYEEIHKLLQKTSDIRMKFVHEVSVIGKHIDDFYEKVSFEKGQIDELLQAVLGSLTTEQKIRGGDLSSGERSIKEKIHADQAAFQSIETTMKSITDLDEQVSKTMIKAFQEIDACNALEAKAWNNFKEIGIILDDKKARVLFYEIENFYKNIEKKIDYLQSNLLTYLENQLSAKITQQTSQIQTTVNSLKAKGLDIQTLLTKDTAGDFVIFKEREELQAKDAVDKSMKPQEKEQKTEKKPTEKDSWYQNLWCAILEYLCPIITKLSEWTAIVWCCIQTLLCKVQETICRLLGY